MAAMSMTMHQASAPADPSVEGLIALLDARRRASLGARVVAIDGRSGAGKSTLARALAERLGAAVVVAGDDFYAGGVHLRDDTPAEQAAACIDWRRQRAVLAALRAGAPATYRAFDWDAFDGSLRPQATRLAPAPVVILEGVYSARPELADLVDVRALVTVGDAVRLRRLQARDGGLGPWERQWLEAEAHYFRHVLPGTAFDRVVAGDGLPVSRTHDRQHGSA